jgi:hypothetical protein
LISFKGKTLISKKARKDNACQNFIELNRGMTDDVLCKEAGMRNIKIGCTIDIYDGFNSYELKSSIIDMLINSVNQTGPAALIQQSDVIDIIREEEGIDNILVPLDKLMFVEDEVIPATAEKIIIRDDNTQVVVLDHQPVVKIDSIEWMMKNGGIKVLKQDGDVVTVQNENLLTSSIVPQNQAVLNNLLNAATNDVLPTNSVKEFYLNNGRIRSIDGKTVVTSDILVDGTISSVVDVEPEIEMTIPVLQRDGSYKDEKKMISKIVFNVPPTAQELNAGVRVTYFYDNGQPADYELVKDTSLNGNTFVASDFIEFLTPFDVTLGTQTLRINYRYTVLNRGDIQL